MVLRGHFSFDAPPTKPLAAQLSSGGGGQPLAAEALIANAVSISSGGEEESGMATIERGTILLYVFLGFTPSDMVIIGLSRFLWRCSRLPTGEKSWRSFRREGGRDVDAPGLRRVLQALEGPPVARGRIMHRAFLIAHRWLALLVAAFSRSSR